MNKDYTDIELINLALENSDNFSLIIDLYEKRLFRYIMRLGDFSLADGEDILQEVFIKIYRHINEYDASFSFSSWAYRIAHNTTIDAYRKKSIKGIIRLDDEMYEELKETLSSEEDFLAHLKEKDMRFLVQNSFQSLTSQQKEVIFLKYIE